VVTRFRQLHHPALRLRKIAPDLTQRLPAIVLVTTLRSTNKAFEGPQMANVFRQLLVDFLSAIVFLAVYAATSDVLIATGVAIAGTIAQFVHARITSQKLEFMTYASLALVIVLGGATLLTGDPRFALIKPSIAHFAIGLVMLRRGWMLRYLPPIVTDNIPEYVNGAGYAWAALMFVLGIGNIAIAMTGDIKLWAFYISVVAIGAKIIAFAVQYVIFRVIITRRRRAAAARA
jgi:intracellular septation protein A